MKPSTLHGSTDVRSSGDHPPCHDAVRNLTLLSRDPGSLPPAAMMRLRPSSPSQCVGRVRNTGEYLPQSRPRRWRRSADGCRSRDSRSPVSRGRTTCATVVCATPATPATPAATVVAVNCRNCRNMTDGAPAEPERELTELEGLQLKINEKSDETLESTRRMREMCAEAKDLGMKSLIQLDDQEEQIDKFESAMDGINQDMALAEKALKAMDMACFGLIPRFWVKDKGFKEDDAVWGEPKVVGAPPPPPATELRDGAFVATILCDAREEEMEENMEQVSAMVGNIRNMANDMNAATVRQNQTLDRINLKAGSDIVRVKMANERAAALMK